MYYFIILYYFPIHPSSSFSACNSLDNRLLILFFCSYFSLLSWKKAFENPVTLLAIKRLFKFLLFLCHTTKMPTRIQCRNFWAKNSSFIFIRYITICIFSHHLQKKLGYLRIKLTACTFFDFI